MLARAAQRRHRGRGDLNLVLYGSLLCLSLFLQQARHQSVLATGLLLLPMSLVVGIGSLASGRLTARFGPRPPILAGLTLAVAVGGYLVALALAWIAIRGRS